MKDVLGYLKTRPSPAKLNKAFERIKGNILKQGLHVDTRKEKYRMS